MKATFRKVYPDPLVGTVSRGKQMFHKTDFSNVRDSRGFTINKAAYMSPEQVLSKEKLQKLHNDIHRQHETLH